MKKRDEIRLNIENLITTANFEIDKLCSQAKLDIIDAGSVSEKIKEIMTKRDLNILEEHSKYSAIWLADDGKHWRTYVLDSDGKRKLKSLTTKENLEKAIIQHYKDMVVDSQTLESIYKNWRDLRICLAMGGEDTSSKLGTINSHDKVWEKYLANSNLVQKDIKTISSSEIKDWLIHVTCDNRLSKKQFDKVRQLLSLLYNHAVDHDIVPINIPKQISKIDGLTFRETTKDCDLSELERIERVIYTDENFAYLKDKAYERFHKSGNTAYLAVLLNTQLGPRVGETVALRIGDIIGNQIHICREEVAKRYIDENGNIRRKGFEIVDHTKSPAGDRYLPLSSECKRIIDLIISTNKSRGFNEENGFLFINTKGERMHENSVNNALAELNGGRKKVDHTIKDHRPHGNHSIRKTCISRLNDNPNLSDEVIRRFAGHSDINTTRRCYMKPIAPLESYSDEIEKSLS